MEGGRPSFTRQPRRAAPSRRAPRQPSPRSSRSQPASKPRLPPPGGFMPSLPPSLRAPGRRRSLRTGELSSASRLAAPGAPPAPHWPRREDGAPRRLFASAGGKGPRRNLPGPLLLLGAAEEGEKPRRAHCLVSFPGRRPHFSSLSLLIPAGAPFFRLWGFGVGKLHESDALPSPPRAGRTLCKLPPWLLKNKSARRVSSVGECAAT